jgi:succinyl-diaminopimelate desuccinylase
MPEKGVNAIDTMRHFLNWLEDHSFTHEEHPLLGGPTVNVGTIEGGVKANVVADGCRVTLDLRTVPGQSHEEVLSEAERALAEICNDMGASYEVRVVNDMAPVSTSESDPFIGLCLDTAKRRLGQDLTPEGAKYYTDASVYVPQLGLPTLVYGPGEPSMAHQPDEWIDVESYLECIRFYIALAEEYLGVV